MKPHAQSKRILFFRGRSNLSGRHMVESFEGHTREVVVGYGEVHVVYVLSLLEHGRHREGRRFQCHVNIGGVQCCRAGCFLRPAACGS